MALNSDKESLSFLNETSVLSAIGRGPYVRVRLGTLNNLRWLAVAGQSAALLIVHSVLGFDVPVMCVLPIAGSAILNIVLAIVHPMSHRLSSREAAMFLAYDILQLAAMLYLTGGMDNPFALLFLAPVVIAAATLDLLSTIFLVGLSFLAVVYLAVFHLPLPWIAGEELVLPSLYRYGIWTSLLLGIGFTTIYARRIAAEAARMSAALTATQLALEREHRLAALGALAAAAAHELGTPLGTIAVVARELERELPEGSPQGEDFRLLREQAERCRAILTRLAQPEEAVLGIAERINLGALLDDIAAPHRGFDVDIVIDMQKGTPPKVWRAPEILSGLGNLIENAADFALQRVDLKAYWNDERIFVDVMDDGPGFSVEIMEKIGEPYVTSRPRKRGGGDGAGVQPQGMGLGFFIAKTLIERTGGLVHAANRNGGGAVVTASWPRGAIDGAAPPDHDVAL